MELKQVILVRQDLKLPKGKMAAQVAHASVDCTLKSTKTRVKEWKMQGQKKVVLKVKDLKELYKYNQIAKDSGLTTSVITDAGHTVLEPGTTTCCGIGPADEESIDAITGELPMM